MRTFCLNLRTKGDYRRASLGKSKKEKRSNPKKKILVVSKLITPDITQCTTHFNSWHSLPPIYPIIAEVNQKQVETREKLPILCALEFLPEFLRPGQKSVTYGSDLG